MLPGQSLQLQHRQRILGDAALRHAGGGGHAVHEIIDQFGNVLAPLGERGHAHRATARRWNRSSRSAPSAMACSRSRAEEEDDPHIDLNLLDPPDAREALLHQHPQDLRLGVERHVGDFVEEQRAARGFLERADLALGPFPAEHSISIVSGVMVAQLSTTKGAPARPEASWMQRAASSLPEPGAPVISTREFTGAYFATSCWS